MDMRLCQAFPTFSTAMYMIDDTKYMTHSLVHCLPLFFFFVSHPSKHFKMQLRKNDIVNLVTLKSL